MSRPQIFRFASEGDWLALRREDLTSTDMAAWLGVSPYATRLDVWLDKRDPNGGRAFEASETMRWGNRLEAAIAFGLAERFGLSVHPLKVYMRHGSVSRMGSSFDFQIVGANPAAALSDKDRTTTQRIADLLAANGDGIFEIKNVSFQAKKAYWDVRPDSLEAPLHVELQVQHQLAVSGAGWAAIGALFEGNDGRLEIRERHEPTIAKLESAVVDFWKAVSDDTPPEVDFTRDLDALKRLYSRLDDTASLNDDELIALSLHLDEYDVARSIERDAKKRKEEAQARILAVAGDRSEFSVGPFRYKRSTARTTITKKGE
jgi:putative phage-type endonuclease